MVLRKNSMRVRRMMIEVMASVDWAEKGVSLSKVDRKDWMSLPNPIVRNNAEPLMTAERTLLSENVVWFCRDIISVSRGCRNVPGDGVGTGDWLAVCGAGVEGLAA